MEANTIIAQTKKWIANVVVGCNFCPFAAREVKRNSIYFTVVDDDKNIVLTKLLATLKSMDDDPAIETAFLILPHHFDSFATYLKLVGTAEAMLKKEGYEGIYQIASFHPSYLFAGSRPNDPALYTNRSPYPMLHLLREESVSKAVDSFPDTHAIPQKNIAFARQKGLAYMQALYNACLEVNE